MSDERVAWLHDYLALIAQERNARPAEAMLADEIEALRSLLKTALDGWDADVEPFDGAGGIALAVHPRGCISARRRISDRQAEAFLRIWGARK